MNVGFSNLFSLKAQMLAANQVVKTDWDTKLTAIGLGVASSFERYCGRKFARTVGQMDVFGADRCQFLLSRFPVEPPVTAVEFKLNEPTGWVVQTSGNNGLTIQALDALAGIVYLPDGVDAGAYYSQMRFTYTGGYFWETLEPTDAGSPTAVPATSVSLPPDLLFAWQMQCRKVWEAIDKIGNKILEVGSNAHLASEVMAGLDLIPEVKTILGGYVRYELT